MNWGTLPLFRILCFYVSVKKNKFNLNKFLKRRKKEKQVEGTIRQGSKELALHSVMLSA